MDTYVYIDGFNLYYRALKCDNSLKWLDVAEMCSRLLPAHNITKIKYFTARIKPNPDDPRQQLRQEIYLRALRTISNLEIIFGKFQVLPKYQRLAKGAGYGVVRVINTEEKQTDVNIASHLIHDAHCGHFSAAVIVSNDSDLLAPVRIVKDCIGKTMGVISPAQIPCRELIKAATFFKAITAGTLQACQFPSSINDQHGTIHRPPEWT